MKKAAKSAAFFVCICLVRVLEVQPIRFGILVDF